MATELEHFPVTHAAVKPVLHPRLDTVIGGRTAVRYLRFLRPVLVERLELQPHVYGRWVPKVPIHPAHLLVSVLDGSRWKVIREINVPPDERLFRKGLKQSMSEEEMNAHFEKVLKTAKPIAIKLGGLKTSLLRVECDREHPVWPSHGECNGGVFNVPFGALNTLRAFGQASRGSEIPLPKWVPILERGRIHPRAPKGVRVRQRGETIIFESSKLSVGFGLRRPILLHLGWDALGDPRVAAANRLSVRRVRYLEPNRGVSGPLLVTAAGDYGCHHWTGEVSIDGNRVHYRRLHSAPGVWIDATFRVEADRLTLEMTQSADRDWPVLEAEAWRLAFGLGKGMTAVAGDPIQHAARAGEVALPAMIAGDGNGALACRAVHGEVSLLVESYRNSNEVTAGFVLGPRADADACQTIAARKIAATVELAVTNLQPKSKSAGKAGLGLRRHWASLFSCFRPEWGGFSNHAASVNCHVNQHVVDAVVFTKKHAGFDPLATARFTIRRALLDGSGYGYYRNLYLDSDPVLVSAAGRIFQVSPDAAWVQAIKPGLVEAAQRLLGTLGPQGLAVCRDLSGNSGSYRWSSNAWDCVGFGHLDAYVNAWTYRALRNADALLAVGREKELARRCSNAAEKLRANFARQLVNPKTGWVVCWKSRDGKLHDYASPWINGVACAFGLLNRAAARRALSGLERLRDQLGIRSARLGVPFMLLPLRPDDNKFHGIMRANKTEPGFEYFVDGSMAPSAGTYYLRALSIHGFKDRAQAMAREMDASFADGLFTGGAGAGMGEANEFLCWEGLASGYEGTFGPNFSILHAIAIEQGVIAPPDPEWWPECP